MRGNRREFMSVAVLAGLAALVPGRSWAQPAGATRDLSFVHPDLRPFADALPQFELTGATLPDIRSGKGLRHGMAMADPATEVPVMVQAVPVPGGPDVTVYIVNARSGARRPAIVYLHGGGFVLASARAYLGRLRALAAELDCVIAAPEYRLAPETRYVGSVADNYAGLSWLHRNAAAVGVDPARIAIMGDSAGGGHAALLALAARDRGEVPVCYQMLIYPMLDDRTGSTRQPTGNIGRLGWTAAQNRFGWESFLGVKPGGPDVPATGVPARAKSVAGLPPTFIGVGSIDLFVNESIDFARRLVDAGVATQLVVVPGAFHGFDLFPGAAVSRQFTATTMAALRAALA